jgi:glycosyltransferase involved in cell wall biosynthesis
MKIKVVTVCKNEERIMPFFINHYEPWVDEILIIDGYSTDKSIEIAMDLGKGKTKIKTWPTDTGQYVDDVLLQEIRNNAWKDGAENFDWMIVCDNDELLYHPKIHDMLLQFKNQRVTYPRIIGYDMVSLDFPDAILPITHQVKRGIRSGAYTKNIIFNPQKITDMRWIPGSHGASPIGEVVPQKYWEDVLKLLHYRRLSYAYHIDKAKIAHSRMGEVNLKSGMGYHNKLIVDQCTEEFYLQEYFNTSLIIK